MSPDIRRELVHAVFSYSFFLNFYLLEKTARAVKRHVGLILTMSGFEFL